MTTNDIRQNTRTVDAQGDFKQKDADSYNAVVDYFDRYTERFTCHMPGPMFKLAQLSESSTVLDVGTGTGVVALDVAQRLGERGSVVGIDLSEGMLATASAKAQQRGLSNRVDFLKMDAEKLDIDDAKFDGAFSLYALRHFPNPDKSVAEIYRVLKPAAKIVAAVGSSPSLFSIDGARAALRRLGSLYRRSLDRELTACDFIDGLVDQYIPEPKQQEFAEWVGEKHGFTGSIEKLMRDAGFIDIKLGWKGQYSCIEDPEDFWLLQMTFSSKARKRLAEADPQVVDALKTEFVRRCEQVLKKKGRLVYQTGAAIVCGTKPLR